MTFADGYDTFEAFDDESSYTLGTVEEELDCGFTRPAGLVWSTPTDMVKFAGFLIDGDPSLLSDDLREQITTPYIAMYPGLEVEDLGYGYGMMINGKGWNGYEGGYQTPLWAHDGITLSMTSALYALPEQRVAVFVATNSYGADLTTTAVTAIETLSGLTPGDSVSLLQAGDGDGSSIAGTWVEPRALGTLILTWDGTDLSVEAPDLEAAGYSVGSTMTEVYEDMWSLSIDRVAYYLELHTDADGGEWLTSRSFVFQRDSGQAGPPAPHVPRQFPAPDAGMRRLIGAP